MYVTRIYLGVHVCVYCAYIWRTCVCSKSIGMRKDMCVGSDMNDMCVASQINDRFVARAMNDMCVATKKLNK